MPNEPSAQDGPPSPPDQPSARDQPEPDKRLELAYEVAQTIVSVQDTTLGNLRTRANNLLAAAAVFTSFSTGIGLLNNDPSKGVVLSVGAAVILLAVVVAIGIYVLRVLWPVNDWCFAASAEEILEKVDDESETWDVDDVRRFVINTLNKGKNDNEKILEKKHADFRTAAMLLVGEIVLLVLLLLASRGWGI
jgi:hypothetical protein